MEVIANAIKALVGSCCIVEVIAGTLRFGTIACRLSILSVVTHHAYIWVKSVLFYNMPATHLELNYGTSTNEENAYPPRLNLYL